MNSNQVVNRDIRDVQIGQTYWVLVSKETGRVVKHNGHHAVWFTESAAKAACKLLSEDNDIKYRPTKQIKQ